MPRILSVGESWLPSNLADQPDNRRRPADCGATHQDAIEGHGDEQFVPFANLATKILRQTAVGERHIRPSFQYNNLGIILRQAPSASASGCSCRHCTDDDLFHIRESLECCQRVLSGSTSASVAESISHTLPLAHTQLFYTCVPSNQRKCEIVPQLSSSRQQSFFWVEHGDANSVMVALTLAPCGLLQILCLFTFGAGQKERSPFRRPFIRPRERADRDSPLTGSEVETFGSKPGRTFKPYHRSPPSVTRPPYTLVLRSSPTSFVREVLAARMASPVHPSLGGLTCSLHHTYAFVRPSVGKVRFAFRAPFHCQNPAASRAQPRSVDLEKTMFRQELV